MYGADLYGRTTLRGPRRRGPLEHRLEVDRDAILSSPVDIDSLSGVSWHVTVDLMSKPARCSPKLMHGPIYTDLGLLGAS